MEKQTSTKKLESDKHNLRIKVLLEKLKNKLRNFSVVDSSAILVGQVKDVHLDKSRQLNLVIAQADAASGSHVFLLRSNHIHQVDYPSKSLSLDITKNEIQELPEYRRSQTLARQMSERQSEAVRSSNSPPSQTPEVNPTPSHYASSYAEHMSAPNDFEDNLESSENEDISPADSEMSDVVEEEVIRLLEERLVVNLNKRKVGEVIVRKEIETRMVEVPVQYEKLIVEQVSPSPKVLAEIDLGQGEIPAPEAIATANQNSQLAVSGEFSSPKTASLLLDAIARQLDNGCKSVRIEILLSDSQHQQVYQEWFDRCSGT
ncbi:YsnF/AvaK domain-containing protein [Aerosakkonema sp. BLCC-F183]|uniref:YsnF/AvaK domain-containing protein n=1 Tax=Aerosakkonema sp. BLCC-F183 TaxID=3342834 RepID=UPI0035B7258D